jgi:hypothetical protein
VSSAWFRNSKQNFLQLKQFFIFTTSPNDSTELRTGGEYDAERLFYSFHPHFSVAKIAFYKVYQNISKRSLKNKTD